jgi:hypothetical protein
MSRNKSAVDSFEVYKEKIRVVTTLEYFLD